MPTYNGAPHVREAVASVLGQTLGDIELIVSDDCSTDETPDIVRQLNDRRIRLFRGENNLGLARNWNKCIELSAGEYICLFHQDDVMESANLASKLAVLEKHPSVGIAFSNALQIDSSGEVLERHWLDNGDKDFTQRGQEFFETLFMGSNVICCPSVLARRKCYETVGDFDRRLPFTADYEMWMRISLFFDVAYLAAPLVRYRWHERNETNKYRGSSLGLEQELMAKAFVVTKFPRRIAKAQTFRKSVGSMACETAMSLYGECRYEEAKRFVKLSFMIYPQLFKERRVTELLLKLLLGQPTTRLVRRLKKPLVH